MEDQINITDRREEKRFNSRKFIFSLGIWLAGTIGWAIHMMTSAEWIDFSKWILMLYLVGNVGESALSYLKK